MHILCLDLEGVLVPEIWIGVAERTGIEGLRLTTRDVPDYDELMQGRLKLLDEHGLGIADIQAVIDGLGPLPGAQDFLAWARSEMQVAILSDTFYEFARPLMAQLGWPMLLCHRLSIDGEGRVADYHIRQKDPKRQAVKALHSLRYKVIAAGDSFNDTSMLEEADAGFFFSAPENVTAQFPQYPATDDYDALRAHIVEQCARFDAGEA
ncbi:MAG TPA: bifunctional phosphoserine phosphatase/homoserine phosphotransferase ThrH [Pseudomonadales bacterium]|nr:bifunctional phosphoserine phosphatase/homoserine phosphotransferase ThrH [Pseudomonadales bacterium]